MTSSRRRRWIAATCVLITAAGGIWWLDRAVTRSLEGIGSLAQAAVISLGQWISPSESPSAEDSTHVIAVPVADDASRDTAAIRLLTVTTERERTFYRGAHRYGTAGELGMPSAERSEVTILAAGRQGWVALARVPGSPRACYWRVGTEFAGDMNYPFVRPSCGVYVPRSVEDAYHELDRLVGRDAARVASQTPSAERFATDQNLTLGLWMLNSWGLGADSRLRDALVHSGGCGADGICDPEAFVYRLLVGYYAHLKGGSR